MSIRYGVSPIAWINDDMPELGGDTPVGTVLEDAAALGFAGIELGGTFPRDPGALRALLDRYGLKLVGGWYSSSLLDRSANDEIAAMQAHLSLLEALGSTVFIIAETSNAVHGERGTALGSSPVLANAEWAEFGSRLSEVAGFVEQRGLKLAYHHHLGTVVETAGELDRFLAASSAKVGLTLDSGHASLGGIDPIEVIRAAPERVVHVHCKDVRRSRFEALAGRGGSFLDGVVEGMFTVPGDGELDFAKLMKALAGIGYSGWIVVEAEQDPAQADPREYARLGLAALRRDASAAGLEETG